MDRLYFMKSIWSGSLSFGLINIPVKVYSASKERALKFRMLDKNSLCPIGYMKVCQGTTKEIKYEDIVRGYEYQKGDFVILNDEDFVKASPRQTKSIDIISFINADEIDRKLIEKPYYIEPDKKGEKAYVLLRDAMEHLNKVAVGKIVFKEHEHLALIEPKNGVLTLIQLRYEDEIKQPDDLRIPESIEYSKKEMDFASMLIKELSEKFNVKKYKDTYTEALKKLIDKKMEGKPIHIEEKEPIPSDMSDIMELLQKSLEKTKSK